MDYDVFISHSSKDYEIAEKLCKYLEGNGIRCWIAPRDVTAGMPYSRAILQGIDESQLMLLLFSDNANKSRHIESEIDRAFNKEKIIIPFRITDTHMSDVLSYYLCASHYIDGFPNPASSFEKLKVQIEKNLPSKQNESKKSLPNKQKENNVDELLHEIAEQNGISVEDLKNAIEGLRTSQEQSFEDLLKQFLSTASEQGEKAEGCLPNDIGTKGSYSILQNDKGEIMLMMSAREGKPDNPRFIYDGSGTALLYRGQDSSIAFRNISEGAREPLKNAEEILVVEIVNDDVEREYMVPVRIVKNVENLIL